jgi:hypothetical protein
MIRLRPWRPLRSLLDPHRFESGSQRPDRVACDGPGRGQWSPGPPRVMHADELKRAPQGRKPKANGASLGTEGRRGRFPCPGGGTRRRGVPEPRPSPNATATQKLEPSDQATNNAKTRRSSDKRAAEERFPCQGGGTHGGGRPNPGHPPTAPQPESEQPTIQRQARHRGTVPLPGRSLHRIWASRCRKTIEGPPKRATLQRPHLHPPEAVALHLSATRPQNNRRSAEKAAPQRPHLPPPEAVALHLSATTLQNNRRPAKEAALQRPHLHPPRGRSVSSANRERGTSGPSLKESAQRILGGEKPLEYNSTPSPAQWRGGLG